MWARRAGRAGRRVLHSIFSRQMEKGRVDSKEMSGWQKDHGVNLFQSIDFAKASPKSGKPWTCGSTWCTNAFHPGCYNESPENHVARAK